MPTRTHISRRNRDTGKPAEPESGDSSAAALVVAPATMLAIEVRRAAKYQESTRSEATKTAYASDWERYRAWALQRGVPAIPAAAETVAAHIGWLADEGYSVSTIQRFLTAATFYHHAADHDFPGHARVVKSTLKGIRRRIGVGVKKKEALGERTLIRACDRLGADGERTLQQRALLITGWFFALRSANLVAIKRQDLRFVRRELDGEPVDDEDAPNGVVLTLPKSKTDQEGKGRKVAALAQSDASVCPVRVLLAYLKTNSFADEDRIFPISKRTVSRLIKRVVAIPEHDHKTMLQISSCERCAKEAKRFASHSLRRGIASTLARKNVSEREIMRHGGWNDVIVARGYMDEAMLFENNVTKDLIKR